MPLDQREQFRIFAYRFIAGPFDKSDLAPSNIELFPESLPELPPQPDLSAYRRLGYDVVELPPLTLSILGFGCSPLSCNLMAEEIAVNRFCLIDDFDQAFAVAKRFGMEQPEPGPYVIVEVLKRTDSA